VNAAAKAAAPSALYLGEFIGELNEGASFLDRLSPTELATVQGLGRTMRF